MIAAHTNHSPQPTAGSKPLLKGKDEMNLAEFPLTKLGSRDQRDVLVYEGWGLDAQKRPYQQRWTVRGATGLGIPNEFGDRVILALIALNFQQPLQTRKVAFSRYQLLKIMNLDPEGKNCANLEQALRQLAGMTIESERAFYSKAQDKRVISREAFHLIEKLWLRKYESDAEARAAETTQGYIIWGKELWESLHAGYIKNLDLDFYYRLPSALTRRLYRFLDKRMHHQDQMEIDIFELTGRLGQAAYTKPSEAYRKLKPAIEQLIQARFLASAAAVKRGKYTRVRFSKASPKALRQQKKQQRNQDQQMEQLAMLQTQYRTADREKAAEQFLRTHLKAQLDEFAFNFFARCHLLALHEQTAVLYCPNVVILDWIKKNLTAQIEQVLSQYLADRSVKLTWVDPYQQLMERTNE